MKHYQFAVIGGLLSNVQALQVDRSVPGVVAMPFESRTGPRIHKRAGSALDLKLGARYVENIINITVGTPPQPITLSLDTGSSDTILLDRTSPLCITYGEKICPSVGYYKPNKSSTYKYMNSGFVANFGFAEQGAGSDAKGDVATDTLGLGGITLNDQQIAISYGNSSIAFSILGLGYASAENQVHTENPKDPYDNLPLALAKQGVTNLALFSLWKDQQVNSFNGHLLFGGIDKDKYTGKLVTLPVQSRENGITAFDITLQAVRVNGALGIKDDITGPFNVVLDCGSTGSILSDEMAKPIFEKFGVTYYPKNNSATVDCAVGRSATTIDFKFDGITITIPVAVFVSPYSGRDLCSFGIVAAGERRGLLGSNFLSSAYAVFDISNNQISLAARNFASKKENISAVPIGGVTADADIPVTTGTAPTPTTGAGAGSGPASGTGAASPATTSKQGSASTVAWNGLIGLSLFVCSCLILMM